MSKSIGNTVLVEEMATRWRPVELRYYLAAAHYRSAIEYSPQALDDAARSYSRIERPLRQAADLFGELKPATDLPADFQAAMDEDLSVPAALATVFTWVTRLNTELSSAPADRGQVAALSEQLLGMVAVLGLDPFQWAAGAGSPLEPTVDALVSLALQQRAAARQRRDFEASDRIRDDLAAAGVLVQDSPTGPRWTLEGT